MPVLLLSVGGETVNPAQLASTNDATTGRFGGGERRAAGPS